MIGMAPNLEMLFLFELLLVALVIIWAVAGAVYIAIHDRRVRRETGRRVGTADIAVGATSQERASVTAQGPAPHQPPRREFYERTGLQRGVEMKMRLYSPNDYESELKGDSDAFGRDGYVAALKGYMMLEDEWLDCLPRKAAGLLGLGPGEYGVDEEHKAILLRRLPHGFPACARDCYIDPPVDS
jgi:hypothetical protein